MALMQNIKPLVNPKDKGFKGLVIFCKKCRKEIRNGKCPETGKSIKNCPHLGEHLYKYYVYIPGKDGKKTFNIETRDFEVAQRKALEFKEFIKSGLYKNLYDNTEKDKIEKQNKDLLLTDALDKYLHWLRNENVPAHLRKQRTPDHIKDVARVFNHFKKCLKDNQYSPETLTVLALNDQFVGLFYEYVEKLKISNRTFNKYFSFLTSFLKWFSDEYDLPVRNYFSKVKRRAINNDPKTISYDEFERLLKVINKENGITEYKYRSRYIKDKMLESKRNVYRDWLANAFHLAIMTGLRREELLNLKWQDVKESYIIAENIKVNRIQNRAREEDKKYNYIPLTKSLRKLLDDIGYKQYVNSNEYILNPQKKNNRNKEMADILSRGFAHFYKQLGTGKNLKFKHLRKTFITNLEIYMGKGQAKLITGHTNDRILENNYLDKREIAKALNDFEVFQNESNRVDEIGAIRAKKSNKSKQKGREV